MILNIDPELEGFIPPLTEAESQALEASIVAEGGATDPLAVWAGPDHAATLLDGHNRYRICQKHGLPFEVRYVGLADKEAAKAWMLQHQRARRNLTLDQNLMLDLRQGADVSRFSSLKVSKAKEVFESAPDMADEVVRGKRGIEAAWNTLQLRSGKAPPVKTVAPKGRIHVVIGDTQVKPGVPTKHLDWIGRYIAEQFYGQNVAVIHLGDHWDMPSLSSYDQGKKAIEGRRYVEDIKAGNEAWELLNAPIEKVSTGKWRPERHFLFGNHEERIVRACNDAAFLDGKLALDDLNTRGWTRHRFLEPVRLDGIVYSHYFYHPNTGRPYCGENLFPRLKTIGHSFTMGHQQGLQYALRPVDGRRHHGLVLGSTYLHDEDYLGPQGNANWRGIVVCHQVEDGQYDPMFVSLDYLCRKYEKRTITEFLQEAA